MPIPINPSAIQIDKLNKTYLKGRQQVHAICDLSLDIKAGSCVGIIGPNGSGKSTLLRMLAGLTVPCSGTARLHGRLSAVLDIGTGFHPDLSGADNIQLCGRIMGISRKEMRQSFDDIVSFSGIGDAIYRPVKGYSSGMFLRLAFALASSLSADIMLLDEVLSVGDAPFQEQCLSKLMALKQQQKTLLIISHNLHQILTLCDHYLLLREGKLISYGTHPTIIHDYVEHARATQESASFQQKTHHAYPLAITKTLTLNPIQAISHPPKLHLFVELNALSAQIMPQILFHIHDFAGHILGTWVQETPLRQNKRKEAGTYRYTCILENLCLNSGTYGLSLCLLDRHMQLLAYFHYLHRFQITSLDQEDPRLRQGAFRLQGPWFEQPLTKQKNVLTSPLAHKEAYKVSAG